MSRQGYEGQGREQNTSAARLLTPGVEAEVGPVHSFT